MVFTGGYVAADLTALVREAVEIYFKRESELRDAAASDRSRSSTHIGADSEDVISTFGRFVLSCLLDAKQIVPPSCLRGDAVKIPTVIFHQLTLLY
jgi:hypothetical protein